jgi:hypothetical protein
MPPDADWVAVEDHVFGTAVPGRECGACVACCKLLTIDDPQLQKPAMVLCPNCTGTDCGIYERRPAACRAWYCAWRRIDSMPAETRPDILGVMFEVTRAESPQNILAKLYIRGVAMNSWQDFNSPAVQSVVAMFRQSRLPVWLAFASRMECVHPSPAIQAVLLAGEAPRTPRIANEAAEWRRICDAL